VGHWILEEAQNMATAKKKRPAAVRSRRTAAKSGNSAGRYFLLVLLAGVSLAGGFALRQSGMYHGQIHHWLSVAHLAISI